MRVKKNFIAAFFALFVLGSSPAHAGVPTIDFSNLAEAITSNIMELKNWAEEKAKLAMEMDIEAMLTKMAISNVNNAYANMISRVNKASQDIFNQDLMEQMAPDSDICGNVASSIYTERTKCHVDNLAKQIAYSVATDKARYDLNSVQSDFHRIETARKVLDGCSDLITVDASELTEDQAVLYSQCVQAGSLIGVGTASTFSETEEKASEMQIRLLTGPVPEQKKSSLMAKSSQNYVPARLAEMRKDAVMSLSIASLSEIAKYRMKPGPGAELSPLGEFEMFVSERNTPEWKLEVGGGKLEGESGSEDNTAYRTELLKKMTVLQLKQTEIQVEQFKHQLRLEGLNAAMLSLMIDPLN